MSLEAHAEYIQSKINPVLEDLVTALLMEHPENPIPFMVNWLAKKGGVAAPAIQQGSSVPATPRQALDESERKELERLRVQVEQLKAQLASHSIEAASEKPKPRQTQELSAAIVAQAVAAGEQDEEENTSDIEDEEDDYVDELPPLPKNYTHARPRVSVSAEVYGQFNKRLDFVPPVVPKNEVQKERISSCVSQSFMFSALDEADIKVVIDAMSEKTVSAGETVITQGEEGDNLYVVDSGELEVYKKIGDDAPKMVKEYSSGDAFGELALLYNCPRAATVKARTDVVLWALDRQTFNHIVRDRTAQKRTRHEQFLESVPLLASLEAYERSKIADAVMTKTFTNEEYIIRQGEPGDTFYIIETGEAVATKSMEPGAAPVEVMQYSEGAYFGELALLRNEPRAANVIAKGDVKCIALDRRCFKRLLGSLEDILRRNAVQYE